MLTGTPQRNDMMRDALVTVLGGSGFAGRYVVRALLASGARVRVAARDPRRAFHLKPQGGLGQMQFVAADVLRPDSLARALRDSDLAVNLVGTFGAPMRRVQGEGAANVARIAADVGVSAYVHVSAIGADADAASAYAQSKALGEQATRQALPHATILRPSILFGREDAFVNRFASMIRIAPLVPVVRPGARFQPVFVGDLADLVARTLAEPGRFGGRTLEVGGPAVLTMRQLLEWIAARIGKEPRLVDLPDGIAAGIARLGFLPGAPIDWDQWLMLQRDNVVTGDDALAEAGIVPTPLDAIADGWLVQYRRYGRFGLAAGG